MGPLFLAKEAALGDDASRQLRIGTAEGGNKFTLFKYLLFNSSPVLLSREARRWQNGGWGVLLPYIISSLMINPT